jgi:hypothetical protein
MVLASSSVGQLLLVLKIAFLVLLYLFVWRVIRTAGKAPKATASAGASEGPAADSMILTPAAAAAAGLGSAARSRGPRTVRLVVQRSPSLETGAAFPVASAPLTLGRSGGNDLVLDGDEFASSRHARIEARGDGVWVQDLDSTNGTFVNGARVVGAERISAGDVLRVGETDLRLEES